MVVIHIKFDETDQFLFESTCKTNNNDLIRSLVYISHNLIFIGKY